MVFHTHIASSCFFLVRVQDTSNVLFCDNFPRPHTRSVRPSVRPGTFSNVSTCRWCSLSQPFFVAEFFPSTPEKFVEFGNHYSDFDDMLSETFNDIPSLFYMIKSLQTFGKGRIDPSLRESLASVCKAVVLRSPRQTARLLLVRSRHGVSEAAIYSEYTSHDLAA